MASATTLRAAVTEREVHLLERAVEVEEPARRRCLDLRLAELSADDLNGLRLSLTILLAKRGFGRDWEPNDIGHECEDLIDRLATWHWGKDD